jgi:hypothetical protein
MVSFCITFAPVWYERVQYTGIRWMKWFCQFLKWMPRTMESSPFQLYLCKYFDWHPTGEVVWISEWIMCLFADIHEMGNTKIPPVIFPTLIQTCMCYSFVFIVGAENIHYIIYLPMWMQALCALYTLLNGGAAGWMDNLHMLRGIWPRPMLSAQFY